MLPIEIKHMAQLEEPDAVGLLVVDDDILMGE